MLFGKRKVYNRIVFLLGVAMSVCSITACSGQSKNSGGVSIFYVNPNETGVSSWDSGINMNDTDVEVAVTELLKDLSKDSGVKDSQPAISGSVNLLDHSIQDKTVYLDFSPEYEELGRIPEILHRAAIVRTLTQLKKIERVAFTISGRPLRDHYGNFIGEMTADTFIYNISKEINTYDKYEVKLYFMNEDKQKLVPVYRSVVYKNGISIVKLAVEEIIEGPNTDTVYPTIAPDTRVNSVDIKEGVCYIDFSSEFLSESFEINPQLTLYSVIDTVTEFPEVQSVVFSIDGETEFVFKDFTISGQYERNTEYIQ